MNILFFIERSMGWLRLVGSIKLQVSFAAYCLFYRALLQKRPVILSIQLTEATSYEKSLVFYQGTKEHSAAARCSGSLSKKPYILSKEPSIQTKEPSIPHRQTHASGSLTRCIQCSTHMSYPNSPMFYRKSRIFYQKSPVF